MHGARRILEEILSNAETRVRALKSDEASGTVIGDKVKERPRSQCVWTEPAA